ncbi:MAG: transcription elongation factor GreB [Oceanococcus sp.]
MADYITEQGFENLRLEHQALWKRRREVVAALSAAAAEGDRSENAEYIYRKKELREVDRRLRYLGKRLEELKVPQALPSDTQRVYFGAWVEIEDDDGATQRLRIVGSDETNAKTGWISLRSPMAKALLGRGLDDQVRVQLPSGPKPYVIVDIAYDEGV